MIDDILKKIGLKEKEILIYKELLLIGSSPASGIASRLGLNKSTVKYSCESLRKKSLLSVIKKNGTFIYTAESPKRLIPFLEIQKRQIEEKENDVKKLTAYFDELSGKKVSVPKVTFYEGTEGIKDLYNKILDFNKPIDSFEDQGKIMVEFFPDFVNYFILERKKRKIFNRVICPSTNPLNIESEKNLRSVRNVLRDDLPFTGDIKICGDHVNIISFKKNGSVGISIEDEDVASNFRVLFNYFWKMSGK